MFFCSHHSGCANSIPLSRIAWRQSSTLISSVFSFCIPPDSLSLQIPTIPCQPTPCSDCKLSIWHLVFNHRLSFSIKLKMIQANPQHAYRYLVCPPAEHIFCYCMLFVCLVCHVCVWCLFLRSLPESSGFHISNQDMTSFLQEVDFDVWAWHSMWRNHTSSGIDCYVNFISNFSTNINSLWPVGCVFFCVYCAHYIAR